MSLPRIVLSGPGPRTWASSCHLRIGRLPELEVTLDDTSVSRLHAEVYLGEDGWVVRDRGSSNGTHLNGMRIGRTPQQIRLNDTIQVGNVTLHVDDLRGRPLSIRVDGRSVQIEASAERSWDEAVEAFEPSEERLQRDGRSFLKLMRAGYRLAHSPDPDLALRQTLEEAVAFFGAQRGGIFLTDAPSSQLIVRSYAVAAGQDSPGRPPGKTLATVALRRRRSVLFKDSADAAPFQADSVLSGDMTSIICAVLRSPDRELGVLHLDRGRNQAPFTEADLYLADSLAAAIALGIDRQELVARHHELFLQTITALAQAVEMRDQYTGNHTHRVTAYAMLLAEEIGMSHEDRRHLQAATALHDIGKIGIDDAILRKPGRLSGPEFEQMKTHVLRGAEIIQMIPGLGWALPVVRGHHERWDGRGYPDGLQGEDIPLCARVVAVADAFDAMTSDRPYRAGMPPERAFEELQAGSGTHFDPRCVEAFVRVRPKIEEMLEQEAVFRQKAESGTLTVSRRELAQQLASDSGPHTIPAAVMNSIAQTPMPASRPG
ncbi:MAG: HD domain-containing protein [Planctomycetia bacterium]|nr:HD domain-containing protein [Planctomycetia bacterium]